MRRLRTLPDMADLTDSELIGWLLEGDPAIRWQTHRDLLDSSEATWSAEQKKVAVEGWGARLLAERDTDGKWAGGLYGPKWKSTTYTLLELWRMGLPGDNPEAIRSTQLLVDKPVWVFGSAKKPMWEGCVAGFGLSLSSWFRLPSGLLDGLVEEILEVQLPDGGWNCRTARRKDVKHSSFHTTTNILEGLRAYCLAGGQYKDAAENAELQAREFFCEHHLYRSHSTGQVPDERMSRLPFPPRWHHDILRTLDYFRVADAPRDERLQDPIQVLNGYRRSDGRWPIHSGYSGEVWFKMEGGRAPSRWNTLRALRVLDWWSQS